MATSFSEESRLPALWKLTHYQHDLEVDDEELAEAKEAFSKWHSKLRFERFRDRSEAASTAEFADSKATAEEKAATARSFRRHVKWLQSDPANGLGRQHKMTRTAVGWIPSRQGIDGETYEDVGDHWSDVALAEQASLMTDCSKAAANTPMGAMGEADEQRTAWGVRWDSGKVRIEPQWPAVVADSMPYLSIQAFINACMSSPGQTGLGWDNIHPRALARLPRQVLLQLVLRLLAAETTWAWPTLVGWVVMVLLPKTRRWKAADRLDTVPCTHLVQGTTRHCKQAGAGQQQGATSTAELEKVRKLRRGSRLQEQN